MDLVFCFAFLEFCKFLCESYHCVFFSSQEDLKISSVFSLTGDPTPAAPPLTHMDLPASCSSCKEVLMNGETVYQRKGHTDIFCSSSCLLKFYQMKPVKKTCHFCIEWVASLLIHFVVILSFCLRLEKFCFKWSMLLEWNCILTKHLDTF